jgi:glycosyltransferase involved in cell wall biosynthesis
VVVPVRNRRHLLCDLLGALDAQTYTDFEVIVVDDGSTDGAGEAAAATTVRGRPVRVIPRDGGGAVAARLAGVAISSAEILAFTDSDCRPRPGWLAAAVAGLDQGADMVHGLTRPARPLRPLERSLHQADDGLFATCNVTYRRAAYDAAGGFDQRAADRLGFRHSSRARGLGFGEDTLLGWRVARHGIVRYEPQAEVEHHVFPADFGDWVHRCWMAAAFPALIREVPELRRHFVRRHVLFVNGRRLPFYATVALGLIGRKRLVPLAVGWWVGARLGDQRIAPVGWSERIAAIPAQMALDVVTGAALLVGSARARTPLL